jgi:hypothetical protein
MKLFRRYYLEAIGLWVYFYFLLPWMLSQPSNLVTTGGFVSLFIVIYLIVVEIINVFKQLKQGDSK